MKKVVQVQVSTGIHGHMVKAQNEIKESLNLIDVIVEVLDARIPIASQNPIVNEIVGEKPRIVLLNKSDLADDIQTKKWIGFFESKNICAIPVDTSKNSDIKKIVEKIKEQGEIARKSKGMKKREFEVKPIDRALIIGIPNVGKSTIINKISSKNSLEVGNKPGVTKKKQWIRIENNIDLLDTPGILWPNLSDNMSGVKLALTGNIKQEVIDAEELACSGIHILRKVEKYSKLFANKYKLNELDINMTDYDVLEIIGRKRGCIVSGGEVDMEKAAKCFLEDFKNGKIGKMTLDVLA